MYRYQIGQATLPNWHERPTAQICKMLLLARHPVCCNGFSLWASYGQAIIPPESGLTIGPNPMGNPNPFQGDTAAGKSNPRSRRWLINVPKHAGHNQDIVELLIIKQVGNRYLRIAVNIPKRLAGCKKLFQSTGFCH